MYAKYFLAQNSSYRKYDKRYNHREYIEKTIEQLRYYREVIYRC